MKKDNWALGLGIASIAISVTTLWLCKMDIKPYSSDGASLSIAVLTLVVTIYMAIQIYNAFILKKEIKNQSEKILRKIRIMFYTTACTSHSFSGSKRAEKDS